MAFVLKPIMNLDDIWMISFIQYLQFILYHNIVSAFPFIDLLHRIELQTQFIFNQIDFPK